MHYMKLSILFVICVPISLFTMDRQQTEKIKRESNLVVVEPQKQFRNKRRVPSSIIALDIFDHSETHFKPGQLMREANFVAQIEVQKNPRFFSFQLGEDEAVARDRALFQEYLRTGKISKVILVLDKSTILREACSLAQKMWGIYQNRFVGVEIVPFEDYREAILPRTCIIKGALLLACEGKNRLFLSTYYQKFGIKGLIDIIGYTNYEKIYGTKMLIDIVGKAEYDRHKEAKLTEAIRRQLQILNDVFDDAVIDEDI